MPDLIVCDDVIDTIAKTLVLAMESLALEIARDDSNDPSREWLVERSSEPLHHEHVPGQGEYVWKSKWFLSIERGGNVLTYRHRLMSWEVGRPRRVLFWDNQSVTGSIILPNCALRQLLTPRAMAQSGFPLTRSR